MTGHFPARIRRVIAVTITAAALTLLAACKPIDRTEFGNDPFRTGEAAARAKSLDAAAGSGSTSGSRSTVRVTQRGGGTVTVRQNQTVDTSDDSGVVDGGFGGERRSSTSSIVVSTAATTCWILVVDGNRHDGCGNATISDTRGTRAARVTKVSGSAPIQLQLVTDGTAVATSTVSGNNRFTTVRV